ncbi:Cys-tRNA(Pro) deacylase [Breznakiella homolactica]|uniref:Cys-tRNA(Pro)/Cys-tRNA(Cys) deacylase n=1 Tax=Breznakiella homolactica TaxID=2798577 RepID=A0A7T7XL72_9SPIR|nr:Cys-tRNA(Pro) deacylase [Breznakiella homolactica]QQO08351.1 Cys-tRNA(Pro) deacylase [Breznakiella homolactica]
MVKTNAMRLLDSAGISYTAAEYEVDEEDLSGIHAAESSGIPAERMFKTLVLRGASREYSVFCIPVAEELDLKKAARAAGEKKIDLIPMKDLLSVTGYVRGGCSPIAMKKQFPTFIDETAELFDTLAVSGGMRGIQILLSPRDLIAFTAAVTGDFTVLRGT